MKTIAPAQAPQAAPKSVEVMDTRNRPLLVMPLPDVHRQLLPHRSVTVLIYDQENKLFLQKRSHKKSIFPGRWDVSSSGHVLAGEATRDAALRELRFELGIEAERLRFVQKLPSSPGTGFEFTTVFALDRYAQEMEPNPDEVEEGYFYSAEEIHYLVREFRELLTPGLVHLWEVGLPFPSWDVL
ncbi:NUDIX hydrolase [Paucidesulfovibrio longus]|uniref:NUDIX hydrolase n=1 Tax=Paucidesulfovibrio longus TaxID=889 RepID=UPI0003B6345D|nr:NUDIX domain-containing protein [Paucidesulfovibrio longus]